MATGKQDDSSPSLTAWQPPTGGAGKPFSLDKCPPDAKPFSRGNKARDKLAVDALALELDSL
uniref:hypothetical protein n=1 Tax=Thermomonas sp. TaxID=1971895 RepID=UPI0035B3DA25